MQEKGHTVFFRPNPRRLKCLTICAESDLYEDENKRLLICITVVFSFNGSYWHINSLLSCIVPRISVVTCDQLVTRGREFESRRSLKFSSMVQDSFCCNLFLGFLLTWGSSPFLVYFQTFQMWTSVPATSMAVTIMQVAITQTALTHANAKRDSIAVSIRNAV